MPGIVSKFRTHGDEATAQLLEACMAAGAWQAAAPCISANRMALLWLQEEITHCAAGVRWLSHLHALAHSAQLPAAAAEAEAEGGPSGSNGGVPQWAGEALQHASVEAWFHCLVRRHFHGSLKVGTCSEPPAQPPAGSSPLLGQSVFI